MEGKPSDRILLSLAALIFILFMAVSGCLNGAPKQNLDVQDNNTPLFQPIIMYTEEQPPFNYINDEGRVSGRSTEVVREIMKRLGEDHSIHMVSWADGYRDVLTEPNTAIYSIIMTHERDQMFRWVGPIAELEYAFFTCSDNPAAIRTIDDLRTRGDIAVVRDDARELYLHALHMPNVLPLEDDEACIKALSSGKAEFWLGTKEIYTQNAKRTIWEHVPELRRIDLPMLSHRLYIGFNRKTPEPVINTWQQTLDEIKADGTYDLIQNRYMPYICSWVRCTP